MKEPESMYLRKEKMKHKKMIDKKKSGCRQEDKPVDREREKTIVEGTGG